MSKVYVELIITGPNVNTKIIINAECVEPHTHNGQNVPGEVAMFYQIDPAPPKDERAKDRTPEEDLMYFLLNALIKGMRE